MVHQGAARSAPAAARHMLNGKCDFRGDGYGGYETIFFFFLLLNSFYTVLPLSRGIHQGKTGWVWDQYK